MANRIRHETMVTILLQCPRQLRYNNMLAVVLFLLPLCHSWGLNGLNSKRGRDAIRSTRLSVASTPLPSVYANDTFANVDEPDPGMAIRQKRSLKIARRTSSRQPEQQRSDRFLACPSKRWNERFQVLKEFHDEHGHCNPPNQPEYKTLNNWIKNQRMHYTYRLHRPEKQHLSYLTAEGIRKLESIGFVWNANDAKWEQKYQELVEYKKRHGHCNVPTPFRENPPLGKWVSQQRYKYNQENSCNIKDERIRKLESIGFSWFPKQDSWWSMYEELKRFKEAHGHCRVPQRYGASLGIWVRHVRRVVREYVLSVCIEQRVEGVYVTGLNEERLEALRSLDFCWLPDPESKDFNPPRDIFDY